MMNETHKTISLFNGSVENKCCTLRDSFSDAFSPSGRAHVLFHTLRPPKWLRPSLREASGQDWTSLFEHSLIIPHAEFCHSYSAEKVKY